MSKIKIEDIRKAAIEQGWTVISETYKNLNTPINFECNEGHKVFLPYKNVRDKWECPICQKNQLKKYTEVKPKPKDTFRILALDQATKVSGYSIFDNQTLVAKGTFKTTLDDEIARDNAIKNWLISMVEGWQIDLIGLEAPREEIYKRCDDRVEEMFNDGLLEEAESLYNKHMKNFTNIIGYRELDKYFKGQITLDEAKIEMKKNTRHYAKRQFTFFNNQFDDIKWYNLDKTSIDSIIKDIVN